MTTPALRPLSVMETVDAAFTIYKRRLRDLIVIAAVILVPLTILTYLINLWFVVDVEVDPATGLPTGFGGALIGSLVLSAISFAGTLVISGAIAKTVGDEYVGVATDWRAAMEKAVSRLWPLIGAALLYALGVFLGLLALVIPGIYLAVRWVVSSVTVILEDEGPARSLGRSGRLVAGRWWPVFGVLVVGILIQFFVGLIVGLIFGALLFGGADPASAGALALSSVVDLAVGIFIQPILAVLVTVIYFDLRVRKEGFDVERLADQIGAEPPPPSAPKSEWDEGWDPGTSGTGDPPSDSPFG